MVSIPHLAMGQIGDDRMATSPGNSSPISPKSWEDSLLELDSDLQKICGSPSPASSTGSLHRNPLFQSMNSNSSGDVSVVPSPEHVDVLRSRPRSSSCRRSVSHEGSASGVRLSSSHSGSNPLAHQPHKQQQQQQQQQQQDLAPVTTNTEPSHHYLLRSQSCLTSSTATSRPVTVRHEETSMKLAEKLSRICGPGQLHDSLNIRIPPANHHHRAKDVMTLHHHVFRRESLKSGFKQKVPIEGSNLTDLTVLVQDRNRLVVTSQKPLDHVLAEVRLPSSLNVNHLLCYVFNGDLFIQERSKPFWGCETDHLGPQYIPIIEQGDFGHDLRVVVRVPDVIRYEDLSVRTIDDYLIISRKRASFPGAVVSRYEVTLVLPDMGDNRGVEATLSHSNQLYIVVSFDVSR